MPKELTLAEQIEVLREASFIIETVAHLQGKEKLLLPVAEKLTLFKQQLQRVVATETLVHHD